MLTFILVVICVLNLSVALSTLVALRDQSAVTSDAAIASSRARTATLGIRIAKALGSQANADLFEALNGTASIPFEKEKHVRIAVKVIEHRGNEVITIRRLS